MKQKNTTIEAPSQAENVKIQRDGKLAGFTNSGLSILCRFRTGIP
uniref:Uncharacterized protein n=1 Tax=Arundo donax TaxID=35708 RepID=A0A0A9E818_ARUDO